MSARSIRVAPAPESSGSLAHDFGGPHAESARLAEQDNVPRYRGMKGVLYRLLQCEQDGIQLPKYVYRSGAQAVGHLLCSLFFVVITALLFKTSGLKKEHTIVYTHENSFQLFALEEDFEGDVLVWYDLPEVRMNQRRFVESKDPAIFTGIFQTYSCQECLDAADAQSIRGSDTTFMGLLPGGETFAPCGLGAVSMFIDEFRLHRVSGAEVEFDESDLALPGDRSIYDGKFVKLNNASGSKYTLDGEHTWIGGRAFMEHMKVWFRSQAAPHVRHLWARVPGGLQAGEYNLTFPVNSPIWIANWKVPEKRVVLAEANTLGSIGACDILGTVSSFLVVIQAGIGAVHLSILLIARG